jgi:sterol 14-demethylase
MPVMDSAIRETLRVHAPIHSIFRKVIGDIPVPPTVSAPSESGSYVIPKGYYVLASPGVAQMDTRIWEDAGKWEPTRWTDKSGVAAQAGEQYDNAEGDKVDYGFGGASAFNFLLFTRGFCC